MAAFERPFGVGFELDRVAEHCQSNLGESGAIFIR